MVSLVAQTARGRIINAPLAQFHHDRSSSKQHLNRYRYKNIITKTKRYSSLTITKATSVTIVHEGKEYTVEVRDGESILEAGLEAGIELRHDCKMGVCMMCPAKKRSGKVEQPNAMLSDDVLEQGFVLLCCAQPVGEGVKIETVEEDESLEVQLNA